MLVEPFPGTWRSKLPSSGRLSKVTGKLQYLPYYTRAHGRRLGIWPERTVNHLVQSHGELFICRKQVAFRLGAESSDKSFSVRDRLFEPGLIYKHPSPYIVKEPLISKILKTITVSSGQFSDIFIELVIMRQELQNVNISCINSILQNSNSLKFSDTPKFENLNPKLSVNVLVYENNEVFSLYSSKHPERKHHVNLLMISNNEGKFQYLLSGLVYGHTNHQHHVSVCSYGLYCCSQSCLLTADLPDCSVHPEQKVEYPSFDDPENNIKKFKAIAKTLPVPFVLYVNFEAFLVPAQENKESASNTKVR